MNLLPILLLAALIIGGPLIALAWEARHAADGDALGWTSSGDERAPRMPVVDEHATPVADEAWAAIVQRAAWVATDGVQP